MDNSESTAVFYVLQAKGSYYTADGQLTDLLREAKLFESVQEAESFQKQFDPIHSIDLSMLVRLTLLVEEVE